MIVKALAAAPNAIWLITMLPERETLVVFERLKVATSEGPFGMVAGVQFAGVFQLPLLGLRFQVALPAEAGWSGRRKMTWSRARQILGFVGVRMTNSCPLEGTKVNPKS